MKISFTEHDRKLSIVFTPETPQEVSLLFRFSNNVKKVSPDVFMSFSEYNVDGSPRCYINLEKLSPSKQINSISK